MSKSIQLHDLTFSLFLTSSQIEQRVLALGQILESKLNPTDAAQPPLFVAVLQGAAIFHADLVRAFGLPAELAYVRTRSYLGTKSTGQVEVQGLDQLDLRGRHVVLVEDIADSGRTLQVLAKAAQTKALAQLTTVVLLDKPSAREVDLVPDVVGFTIESEFVVGYGLDYQGLGRNLSDIYRLDAGKA